MFFKKLWNKARPKGINKKPKVGENIVLFRMNDEFNNDDDGNKDEKENELTDFEIDENYLSNGKEIDIIIGELAIEDINEKSNSFILLLMDMSTTIYTPQDVYNFADNGDEANFIIALNQGDNATNWYRDIIGMTACHWAAVLGYFILTLLR